MSDTTDAPKNVYTEDQHFALLTSAVERETAAVTAVKEELEAQVATVSTEKAELETKVSEISARLDVLEAEKAAETAAKDAALAEFEAYKTELAELAAVEGRKTDRVAVIKAANEGLAEEYFTAERAQRWAEMSEDTFAALVADITELAAAAPHAFKAGEDSKCVTCKADAKAPMHFGKEKASEETVETATEQARETAAFKGGVTPTAGEGSTFGQLLRVTGKSPASQNA